MQYRNETLNEELALIGRYSDARNIPAAQDSLADVPSTTKQGVKKPVYMTRDSDVVRPSLLTSLRGPTADRKHDSHPRLQGAAAMSACVPPTSSSLASSSVLSASMHVTTAPSSPLASLGASLPAPGAVNGVVPSSPAPALNFSKIPLDVTGHGGISLLEERRVEKERRATMETGQDRPAI